VHVRSEYVTTFKLQGLVESKTPSRGQFQALLMRYWRDRWLELAVTAIYDLTGARPPCPKAPKELADQERRRGGSPKLVQASRNR
jgi:hypothetical protein